jgi:hypothetical protein
MQVQDMKCCSRIESKERCAQALEVTCVALRGVTLISLTVWDNGITLVHTGEGTDQWL